MSRNDWLNSSGIQNQRFLKTCGRKKLAEGWQRSMRGRARGWLSSPSPTVVRQSHPMTQKTRERSQQKIDIYEHKQPASKQQATRGHTTAISQKLRQGTSFKKWIFKQFGLRQLRSTKTISAEYSNARYEYYQLRKNVNALHKTYQRKCCTAPSYPLLAMIPSNTFYRICIQIKESSLYIKETTLSNNHIVP